MKLAIVIAPFLLVGGYIAADYYSELQSEKKNLFKLVVQGSCNIIANQCSLKHDRLVLKLSDQQGSTRITSNHPLDSAGMSIVDNNNKELQYPLSSDNERLIWQASTQLASLSEKTPQQKIRIIVTLNKGYYFSELTTSQGAK